MLVSTKGLLKKTQNYIIKNSPTILAVIGGVGAVGSVILASDAAIQSRKNIQKAQEELRKSSGNAEADISKADKAVIYVKAYTPTAIMLTATEVCIFGSNHINQKRIATLAGAYIISETNLKEYKEKAEELFGAKKAKEIEDSIIQKHINETPQTPQNTCQPNFPNPTQLSLWFDETSRRYFYSNAEYIRKAEIQGNAQLQRTGFVSINDIYELLGIEPIPLGDDMGWQSDMHEEVVIQIDAAIMGPDVPVGTITMDVHPSSAWISEV